MRITEIYTSIQGETQYAGLPCTLVRTTGCDLRCGYCDSAFAFHGGKDMTLDEIVAEVARLGAPLVLLDGRRADAAARVAPARRAAARRRLPGDDRDLGRATAAHVAGWRRARHRRRRRRARASRTATAPSCCASCGRVTRSSSSSSMRRTTGGRSRSSGRMSWPGRRRSFCRPSTAGWTPKLWSDGCSGTGFRPASICSSTSTSGSLKRGASDVIHRANFRCGFEDLFGTPLTS